MEGSSPDALARWVNAHEVYCEPWSLWITVWSGIGVRLVMAMPRALVTSEVACWLSIDQPTTRRENTSRTTQQYTLPSRVGCSVMSVTHSWSGAGRSKRRSTRSAAVALFALLRNSFLDPGSPYRPCNRMILRTVLRLTITPWP